MVVKNPVPVLVQRSIQPTTILKASVIVTPEEMEAGIPFKAFLAHKFAENLEDYMVIEKERLNDHIRITGTIRIVGGNE